MGRELEGVITEFGVAHSPADIYNLGEIKSG